MPRHYNYLLSRAQASTSIRITMAIVATIAEIIDVGVVI